MKTPKSSSEYLSQNRLCVALAYLNVLVLLLPLETSDWEYTATITPWLWVLYSTPSRARLTQIVKENRSLVLVTALASIWMLIGSLSRQVADEWRIATTPILWLPIAAIFKQHAHQTPPQTKQSVQAIMGIAILSTSTVLAYQLLIGKDPRPPGFSFNVLTGPMLLMMASLFIAADQNSGSRPKLLLLIGLASIGGSMMTQSRTALLCFIVGCGCCALFLPKISKNILAYSMPTSIIWMILISPRFDVIHTDISKYQNGSHRSSLGERTDAIVWGLQHIFDKPWLGFGREPLRNTFNSRWIEWSQPEDSITKILHLHNDYLQLALSYGMPTLVFTLIFWVGLFKLFNKPNIHPQQSTFCKITLLIIATTSLVDSFTHWQGLWAMCATCAGIAFSICHQTTACENRYSSIE